MSPEEPPPPSRRAVLRSGVAAALGLGLAGCGFLPEDRNAFGDPDRPIEVRADGDLV